jgi:hypothetical protein
MPETCLVQNVCALAYAATRSRGRADTEAAQSPPASSVHAAVVDERTSVVIDRASPSAYPAKTPRRDAGLDARTPTGSTPAGGDAGTSRTPREALQPPLPCWPDEGIDSALGEERQRLPAKGRSRKAGRRGTSTAP